MDISDRIERRLKLHDLRVLMTVVQAGSMSKAAERLGTAQPALSRSIAELACRRFMATPTRGSIRGDWLDRKHR